MADPRTTFFRAGARAKERGDKLAVAISCLRAGCWQYDAFIEGYDSIRRKRRAGATAKGETSV